MYACGFLSKFEMFGATEDLAHASGNALLSRFCLVTSLFVSETATHTATRVTTHAATKESGKALC